MNTKKDNFLFQAFKAAALATSEAAISRYLEAHNQNKPKEISERFTDSEFEAFVLVQLMAKALNKILEDETISLNGVLSEVLSSMPAENHARSMKGAVRSLDEVLSADAIISMSAVDTKSFGAVALSYKGPNIKDEDGNIKVDASIHDDGLLVTMASSMLRYSMTLAKDLENTERQHRSQAPRQGQPDTTTETRH